MDLGKWLTYPLALAAPAIHLAPAAGARAAERDYVNRGALAGVNPEHRTVVVEVPVGGQPMTVGDPLVPGATLKSGDRAADLDDFQRGTTVAVRWRYPEEGHRILTLRAPQEPADRPRRRPGTSSGGASDRLSEAYQPTENAEFYQSDRAVAEAAVIPGP